MMKTKIKKVVGQVKTARAKLEKNFGVLKGQDWVEEARKYAEKQSKEMKKLLATDAKKVQAFVTKERKELEKLQKQLPAEVEKLRTFVLSQRKEFEKLITKVRKNAVKTAVRKTKPARKKAAATAKKTTAATTTA
jgi:bisphosphoglycerate-dependent phosphoglycerate mutase